MQKIVSQIPELSLLLSRLPNQQHQHVITHLLKLGLEASRSYCYRESKCHSPDGVQKELHQIKCDIQALNSMVRSKCCHGQSHSPSKQTAVFPTQPISNDQCCGVKTPGKISRQQRKNKETSRSKCCNQKPVKDLPPAGISEKQNTASFNPFAKAKAFVSRHHLDDTAARQALQFPASSFIEKDEKVKLKRSSQDYKKHIYQQQINKEQLIKIKEEKGQSPDRFQRTRRERAVSDYSKATSKIKTLLDKDKIRHLQRQREHAFKQGFNQYQYSDDDQMEQSSMKEDSQQYMPEQTYPKFYEGNTYSQHYQSSIKASNQPSSSKSGRNRTSSKKQFSRSKNELSSKIDRSLGEEIRIEHRSQNSSNIDSNQKYMHQESNSGRHVNIEYDNDEDVISNSSSFSQFSINGSRKKQVGKISRRSQKE